MNPNVWNIKEILSMPHGSRWNPGGDSTKAKQTINTATSGHSSLTDSQFAFGSQFWPENSQSVSQEMSFPARASQQSSQEGSEQKISSNYHTKPFLIGGERTNSSLKVMGVLDKFEEDKKKAKEKSDSDALAKEFLHFRETLSSIQQLIVGTDKNTSVCKTILEGFDNFATLQKSISSIRDELAQQFELTLKEVRSQKQMLTKIEENLLENRLANTALGSHVQDLQNNLAALRQEQERERVMLEEARNLLDTLACHQSAKRRSGEVADSAIQTSPGLVQPFSNALQSSCPEGEPLPQCQIECTQPNGPSQEPRGQSNAEPSKSALRGHSRRRRRPLMPPQRSKAAICNENRRPSANCLKTNPSSPLRELNPNTPTKPKIDSVIQSPRHKSKEGRGSFKAPISPWSLDSNSSPCAAGAEAALQKSPSWSGGLWQLFEF